MLFRAPLGLFFGINIEDVKTAVGLIQNHLIALAVCLVLAIVVTIAAVKAPKGSRGLVRGSAWVAFGLALVLIVNMILTGPMYSMVSLALKGGGDISEENITSATALCEEIAEEGIVLLKNDGVLPLAEKKVNTFGWSSTNPVYGGTGSGSLSAAYPTVTLLQGLEHAGISYNTTLTDFYTNWRSSRPMVGMWGQDWTIPEPTIAEYDAAGIFDNAKSYCDTALVVIARSGGEGADLPTSLDPAIEPTFAEGGMFGSSGVRLSEYADDLDASKHFLELTNREKAMVERVTSEFSNVIVIINGANAFELGWTDEYPSIKGVLLVPGTGQSGFNALGDILTGAVNPSGKTVDTYVYDLKCTPYFYNIGDFKYTNLDDVSPLSYGAPVTPTFVNYTDGIYVGYRFWETAAEEGFLDYETNVQYPFGYGLSYTTFSQTMSDIKDSNGTLSIDVTVTNTGNVAGKDVVQVYYNPPYTNGGIEKASANLAAFAKTDLLQPGASQTVTISFKAEDMASFDAYGAGAWVLEAGDYQISINSDAHNKIDSRTYNVPSTITYAGDNKRSTDVVAATPQFSYAKGEITYLSRNNHFANYDAAVAPPSSYEMSAEAKAGFYNQSNYDPNNFNNASDVAPTTGKKSGLTMADMKGLAYDDPKWETMLDQLTVDEMVSLISVGGYQSVAVPSIGKTQQVDCDGPASINNNFSGKGSIGFPAGVMIAATWNTSLARSFGSSIGSMADEMDVSGWYAPAMNIHRSAFAGRNFEYYSEDGLVSGKMASNAILGAGEHGVYSFMKHFALNDQETNRTNMLCTWSTEQAIREIYLKPFELCVKEGGCTAVMSSFNYIGNKYSGANTDLLNTVLRGEWGFRGMVLTDYFGGYGYQDADIQIRNGNDFCLTPQATEFSILTDTTSATSQLAMRQAAHNILYTTANSRAYGSGTGNSLPAWQMTMYIIDAVAVVVLVAIEVLMIRGYLNKSKKAKK